MLCLLLLPILGVQVEPEAVADENPRTASNFDAHALQFHVENEKNCLNNILFRYLSGKFEVPRHGSDGVGRPRFGVQLLKVAAVKVEDGVL